MPPAHAPSFSTTQPLPSHHHHRRRQHAQPSHSPCSPWTFESSLESPRSSAPGRRRGERLDIPAPGLPRRASSGSDAESASYSLQSPRSSAPATSPWRAPRHPLAPGLPRRASSGSGAGSASTPLLPALRPPVAGALHRTLQPWSGLRFVWLPTSSLLFFERIKHRHIATQRRRNSFTFVSVKGATSFQVSGIGLHLKTSTATRHCLAHI